MVELSRKRGAVMTSERIERVCSLPPRQSTWVGLAQALEELALLRRLASEVSSAPATSESQRYANFENKE